MKTFLNLLLYVNLIYNIFACKTVDDCYDNGKCIDGECVCLYGFNGINCEYVDTNSVINITRDTTFISNDWRSSWGSTPMKDDNGTWHLFVGLFKNKCTLNSWLTNGVIGHLVSTSDTPLGPYVLNGIAIDTPNNQTEINMNWDGLSVYNPAIIRNNDGKYLLYYTGTSVNGVTHQDCSNNSNDSSDNLKGSEMAYNQRIGLAVSDSLYGPWIKYENNPILKPNITDPHNWNSNFTANPAPLLLNNGSIVVVYKARSTANFDAMYSGTAISNNNYKGPYMDIGNEPFNIPTNCEDEYLWNNEYGYHLLFHCGCSQMNMYSHDLISWNNNYTEKNWCHVNTTNGVYTYKRRERPSLLFVNPNETYLFTAVEDTNGIYYNLVQKL